jgi:iron transport multicopper oxidase
MDDLGNGWPYAFFNNISYTPQRVPTLYTVLTTGENATSPEIYSEFVNPFVLKAGQTIELIVNNLDGGKHPLHLHGHNFQILHRSLDSAGTWEDEDSTGNVTFPAVPSRRDTLVLQPSGNFVLRFKADNPGVWLFHCHIEWHMSQGLIATMIEDPIGLQKSQPIESLPAQFTDLCKAQDVPMAGNAVGNTVDVFNLNGQDAQSGDLPAGFTARGIVALVFSVLCAFLGMAVIAWYGMGEIGEAEKRQMEHMVTEHERRAQL